MFGVSALDQFEYQGSIEAHVKVDKKTGGFIDMAIISVNNNQLLTETSGLDPLINMLDLV